MHVERVLRKYKIYEKKPLWLFLWLCFARGDNEWRTLVAV